MIRWTTIRPRVVPAPRRAGTSLDAVLARRAVLGAFLEEAAGQDESVLLLVNDSHRSTRTRDALREIARIATRAADRIAFDALIAGGTHTFDTQERRTFERDTFDGCGLHVRRIDWHDARDSAAHASLGGAALNRRLVDARFCLPIGSVEPHYFAGLTGAHKTLTIGCMSRDDIERNHAGALDPASDVLALDGNPVYDGIARTVRAVQAAGTRVCAINQVVVGADLIDVAVGDPLDTLRDLLETVRQTFVQSIDRPADVLELIVPPPLGRSLYQADKAFKNNHRAVRDGGGIVLNAACEDGIGPDAFFDLLRDARGYDDAVRMVSQRGYRLGDHKAVKLRHLTDPAQRGVHVALVSDQIEPEDAAAAGMRVFADAGQAHAWLAESLRGTVESGVRIEDAGFVSVSAA